MLAGLEVLGRRPGADPTLGVIGMVFDARTAFTADFVVGELRHVMILPYLVMPMQGVFKQMSCPFIWRRLGKTCLNKAYGMRHGV